MVMGRDSHSKGHGFESRHRILDGHFFTYICCKNCIDVCLKRPKINEKEAGVGLFIKPVLWVRNIPGPLIASQAGLIRGLRKEVFLEVESLITLQMTLTFNLCHRQGLKDLISRQT